MTLRKNTINPTISRWALELHNYDYNVEHRSSDRMVHADALSRSINILHINDENFEFVLAATQRRDPKIVEIASKLSKNESPLFDMVDGLIYRKINDELRFVVSEIKENRVIQTHHEMLCHLGVEKCYEHLSKIYWFTNMKKKVREYIKNCLKCIYFSPNSGKVEGTLHNIPKGNLPFDTLHIDHYGPLWAFTSKEFEEGKNVVHIKIATASPQSNGQLKG